MFGKSLNRSAFKKLIGATLLALVFAGLVPSPASAAAPPTINGSYQSSDLGSTITVTGTGFNGVVATLGSNPTPLTVSGETPTSVSITVPSYAITSPSTSASVALKLTNSDFQWAQTTLTYYAAIPAFVTPAAGDLSAGIAGKTITLTADNTCLAPTYCLFDSGATATIQFGTGPITSITLSPNLVTGASASLTLPPHTMSGAFSVDVGHVVIQNPNGQAVTQDFSYYAAPSVSFASPGTAGAPNAISTGAPMAQINLSHPSGYCTNLSTGSTAVPGVDGVSFTWNATTQSGYLSGTPVADMVSAVAYAVTCSNAGGADSTATIYLKANKLAQTVASFTLSGATGTAPNYTAIFGNTSLSYAFTTTPVSGGGAVTVTSSDACVTVDQAAKTLSITCVPVSAVTLTATAAATATYNASSPATFTLTVSKATQTIPTFTISGATGTAPNYTATFGNTSLSYAFTTTPVSGGGAVTVTSSDACVTVDQVTKTLSITCVPVSAVTLTATAADTVNYSGPVTKTATLTVSKGRLVIAFTPNLLMISGGATQDISLSTTLTPVGTGVPTVVQYAVAPGSSTVCSLNGTAHTLTALAVGNCVVTATALGNANMLDAVPVQVTIVVQAAASQVLSFSGLSTTYTYGAADVTFHVTDLFGDTLQVTSVYSNTASVTQTGPTTYVFHVSQPGNAVIRAYDPRTNTTKDFNVVVAPKPVTLSAFMATVSSNGTVTFDPATVTGVLPGDYVQVDASQVVGSYSATGQLTWTGIFKLIGASAQNYVIAAQPVSIAVHPVVFGITPAFGSPVGGNTVVIRGAGFTPNALVSFGTSVASKVKYLSASSLEVVTPAHANGTVTVVVAIQGVGSVSSPTSFEYKPLAPVITSVSPGSSSITGGTLITVTGENFASDITVTLDGASLGVQSVTANTLTFVTPAHAVGSVTLSLANPQLPSVSWPKGIVYILPIKLNQATVQKAWTTGGTKVVLSGENFETGITVAVMGISATNVLVVDSKTLSFTLPVVPKAGLADVSVTTAQGQVTTLTGALYFVKMPEIQISFGNGVKLGAKSLSAIKKFAAVVKKSHLKLSALTLFASTKSGKLSKSDLAAVKSRIQAIKNALAASGLHARKVITGSAPAGTAKNTVVVSGT